MRLEQPPLLHDGGYWYVVPVVFNEIAGIYSPDLDVPLWCAWYAADYSICILRSPHPATGFNSMNIPANTIVDGVMPTGRIGGA